MFREFLHLSYCISWFDYVAWNHIWKKSSKINFTFFLPHSGVNWVIRTNSTMRKKPKRWMKKMLWKQLKKRNWKNSKLKRNIFFREIGGKIHNFVYHISHSPSKSTTLVTTATTTSANHAPGPSRKFFSKKQGTYIAFSKIPVISVQFSFKSHLLVSRWKSTSRLFCY